MSARERVTGDRHRRRSNRPGISQAKGPRGLEALWKADAMHPTEGVSRRKRRAKALRSSDRGGAAWDKSRRFAAFHAHSGDWNERPLGQETPARQRSEEHTSELQSLMRISYAVFCLKKK